MARRESDHAAAQAAAERTPVTPAEGERPSRLAPPRRKSPPLAPPASLSFLFAHPPLIPGEREEEWRGLVSGLAASMRPAGTLDWLRLRDAANGIWEGLRLERFRDTLVSLQRGQAAAEMFERLLRDQFRDPDARRAAAESLARGWVAERDAERREGRRLLRQAGLRDEAVEAAAFLNQIETHERLDRLRRRAEAARDQGLAHAATGADSEDSADVVIDAEVVPAPRRIARRTEDVEEAVVERVARRPKAPKPPVEAPAEAPRKPAADPQPDLFGALSGGAAH